MKLSELGQLKLNIRSDKGEFFTERGLTLMEVLLALLISGIFLVTTLRFLTDQWRGASTLKNHLEAHYAVMTAGKTALDAIRTAQTVEWVKDPGVLKVLPLPDDANLVPSLDSYFVNDLDFDGTKDLYWKHLGISQPLASFISRWECTEVEPGLWNVLLEASVDGQVVTWHSVIRQRVHSPESPISQISQRSLVSIDQRVMLAFLSSFY